MCNYPIRGTRLFIGVWNPPNTRKYYKLLVINTQWNLVDRFTRTKCITNSGYKYLLYLIFQRENVSYYYFWGKHQTEKYVFYYIYIYIEKPRCASPYCFQFVKTKFHSYYKLLAHNSRSTTLRNGEEIGNLVLRLLKFRDYERSDRPIAQLRDDGRSTNPIKQKSIEIYASGWFVLGTGGASAFRKRLGLSNRSCPPCENHFPITTKITFDGIELVRVLIGKLHFHLIRK